LRHQSSIKGIAEEPFMGVAERLSGATGAVAARSFVVIIQVAP
jgi:Na+-translocating ferredoxin:NAD+ oxidoreductase RnfA subunit